MNDGYIQSKQRELNEELKRVEEKTKTLQQRIDTMDEKIVGYNALILALKKQENFQEQLKKDLMDDNIKTVETWIQSDELRQIVVDTITDSLSKFKKATNKLAEVSRNYRERVEDLQKDHSCHILLFKMLTDKLVKKGILSESELRKLLIQGLNLNKRDIKESRKYDIQELRKQLRGNLK